MTDEQRMLADMAGAIFGAYGEANATIADWHEIEASGMTTLMVPEAAGGFGGGWSDGAVLFRLVGYHAVALPTVEATIVAGYVAGIDGLSGFGTIAGPAVGRASCRARVSQYVYISVVPAPLKKTIHQSQI